MRNRVDILRKKMDEKRRKRKHSPRQQVVRERDRGDRALDLSPYAIRHDHDREDYYSSYDNRQAVPYEKDEAFFSKDRFLMQVLASICLFFSIGIVLQSQSTALDGVRGFVERSFHEDFQFSAVAGWYEDAFGRPLALLPPDMHVVAPGDMNEEEPDVYALPATGTIRQSFEQNGRGIYVETSLDRPVQASLNGIVTFVGEDEAGEWGKVIQIRHNDGKESWYGMLDNISVQIHDQVESGDKLGYVSPHQDLEGIGVYYFALREGDTFIDPVEVIGLD